MSNVCGNDNKTTNTQGNNQEGGFQLKLRIIDAPLEEAIKKYSDYLIQNDLVLKPEDAARLWDGYDPFVGIDE